MNDNDEQSIPSRGSVAKCHACGADCVEGYDAEGVLVRVPARGRWIPVTERCPAKHLTVLVWSQSDGLHLARLDLRGQWRDADENFGKKITHWMLLPAPPTARK